MENADEPHPFAGLDSEENHVLDLESIATQSILRGFEMRPLDA